MRGRRDELSYEYQCFTINALGDYLAVNKANWDKSFRILKKDQRYLDSELISNFKKKHHLGNQNAVKALPFDREVKQKNPLVALLTTKRQVHVCWDEDEYDKAIFLGNDKDIMMVLDTLKFIVCNDRMNVYSYLIELIKKDGVKEAYEELDKISNVGDKIAAFTIRDIGLINPNLFKK